MTLCGLRALAIVVFTASLASAQTAPTSASSAASFDGEWAGSGGIRLVLRADPAGLTGTVTEPAGAGPITIERGSVSGRTATFVTSRSVNGEPVTVTWTAELHDDDTLAVSRLMDGSGAARGGREGRGAAAGARGRGERGAGPRAGARAGRGEGRAGRGRAGGGAPPEAGRGGERGRAGGGERGRAGDGERGRAGGGRRGGGPAARGAGDVGGFPEILRRVP